MLAETWWDPNFQQQIEKKASDPVYRQKATQLMAEMHNGGPLVLERSSTQSFFAVLETDMWAMRFT